VQYTAFASKRPRPSPRDWLSAESGDLNKQPADGHGELFPAWRYHAAFTDFPFELAQAESAP
jgi:hypothetical protein